MMQIQVRNGDRIRTAYHSVYALEDPRDRGGLEVRALLRPSCVAPFFGRLVSRTNSFRKLADSYLQHASY